LMYTEGHALLDAFERHLQFLQCSVSSDIIHWICCTCCTLSALHPTL
jgi:hypothetical protein